MDEGIGKLIGEENPEDAEEKIAPCNPIGRIRGLSLPRKPSAPGRFLIFHTTMVTQS